MIFIRVSNSIPFQTNVVWVSCEGENPADVENIKARDYYPRMGFPYYYFPFKNIEGYIPPIVAVQFTVESNSRYSLDSLCAAVVLLFCPFPTLFDCFYFFVCILLSLHIV